MLDNEHFIHGFFDELESIEKVGGVELEKEAILSALRTIGSKAVTGLSGIKSAITGKLPGMSQALTGAQRKSLGWAGLKDVAPAAGIVGGAAAVPVAAGYMAGRSSR